MPVFGKIHSFESFGTLDGPGIRFVVFLQGCPLRCRFCHNPDTWSPGSGETKSVDEILEMISSCRSFFRSGGVTLSGGEPLLQPEFSLALLQSCKGAGFHTALDTAGSLPLEKTQSVIREADMLLLDLKSLDSSLCRELTGADNTHTLETLEFCERIGKRVWLRHVLVPGWTLEESKLENLARFLLPFQCVERIELLPFHKMGHQKWAAAGMCDPFEDVPVPSPRETEHARELFRRILPEKTIV